MIPRLKEEYEKKIVEDLQQKFSLKNKYMVPKFVKVVLNMGLGLDENDIEIVYESQQWFKYQVPKAKRKRYFRKDIFKGQKQKWFLAKLLSDDNKINLRANMPVEFDKWVWANYWYPLHSVIAFKKEIYKKALLTILPEYNKLRKNF